MQGVAAAVVRMGLEFDGYLDPTRAAVIDDAHMVRLNYETYFFADDEGRTRFVEDPLTLCGLLTDPISQRRFLPRGDAPSFEHAGVTYYFESEYARDVFRLDPDVYRLPRWSM